MNQIDVLLTNLNIAKEYRLTSPGNISAQAGWAKVTGIKENIPLLRRMNELTNIALKLDADFKLENEIDGEEHESDWVSEVISGLSLYGSFVSNIDQIHNHTFTIIRKSVRNWNHGYTVQSKLDEAKIKEFLSTLIEERNSILFDDTLTYELKKILLKEIDKLIYSLENFSIMGEEFLKEAVTDFYSEAFFNKDVQQFYRDRPSFKDVIDAISACITIGPFAAQTGILLLGLASDVVTKISL
ncbi:hypothetical protein F946_01065 [Acinetobacter johnsonii ANC 3681]|uniref:Uncharacterized protein n=1 Tax=Acinetobacter johnsonii ANC 3681 TaxID=1217662 RepID=N9CZ55_ACIJO|nr:DUF1744 domain-containing protein [Acinetobacter johnsonii]ENV73553.1 hypothetical protein F946_01065 [Acinetobacter johnsonii ANC 3681]